MLHWLQHRCYTACIGVGISGIFISSIKPLLLDFLSVTWLSCMHPILQGSDGVEKVLSILKEELEVTMRLAGN